MGGEERAAAGRARDEEGNIREHRVSWGIFGNGMDLPISLYSTE